MYAITKKFNEDSKIVSKPTKRSVSLNTKGNKLNWIN